jgi:L-serine/L-threonine ammonia-lyase
MVSLLSYRVSHFVSAHTFFSSSNIYLKLENLQPSGSFKSRGIGNFMTRAAAASPDNLKIHFYCPSGGNAGLACATTAQSLGLPATIVLPTIASPLMRGKLAALGAEVHSVGSNWAECNAYLHDELLSKDPGGIYVPPFDHEDVWAGAATLVDEARTQVEGDIDAIVCSVGGGGLLNGIMKGVLDHAWTNGQKPRVLALETIGADSLNASVLANDHVTLPAMSSIATSLGAIRVSAQTWHHARDHPEVLKSLVVSDADAAISCVRFADDARILVEPACGATLATVYRTGMLRKELGGDNGVSDEEWKRKNVVLVVCGGSGVTLKMLEKWRETFKAESSIELGQW